MTNRNGIMRKMKLIFIFTLIVVAVFNLTSCGSKKLSTEPTAYYMIYSGRDNKKCRIEGIDVNGNPTVIHNIDAANITKSAVVGDEFFAVGHRKNNHLLMQQDGSFEGFYLLDNPTIFGRMGHYPGRRKHRFGYER